MFQNISDVSRVQSIQGVDASANVIRPNLSMELERISPAVLSQLVVPVDAGTQINLPDTRTRNGNLFRDRFNTALYWYLPSLHLADDPDTLFSFSASQAGVDGSGNPFHKACLQLSLKQDVPQDVAAFETSNPTIEVRPIPFHDANVTLSTTYADTNTGSDQHSSFVGMVSSHSDGSLQLTFDNLLGNNVLILYSNLTQGGAQIAIAAVYDVWISVTVPRQIPRPPLRRPPFITGSGVRILPEVAMNSTVLHKVDLSEVEAPGQRTVIPIAARVGPIGSPIWLPPDGGDDSDNAPMTRYVQSKATFNLNVSLIQKYAVNDYQLKYTVTENSITRPIININDLKNFDVRQSEFIELKVIGDVSQRYPSLSKLYIGTLSRTIVVIPSEYTIAREISHCNAVCAALVDSSPTGTSHCKFQFEFLLAPNINPIELLQLSQEISHYPDFKNYSLKFPDSLNYALPSTITTLFQSVCEYTGSAIPHNFSLAVEVTDANLDSPAIANANLLIKQLCSIQQPYLSGTINLKLDDDYPSPVTTTVILNFQAAIGTGDIVWSIDESTRCINLTNRSAFDLLIKRYALCTSQGVTLLPLDPPTLMKGGQAIALPLPADHTGLTVLVDSGIELETAISKSAIDPYLQFQQKDVQNTQYQLIINASGVNFDGRGIDKIEAQISLPALPDVSVPAFSLYQLRKAANASILIPLQYAISSLNATLLFTVSFKDASKPSVQFSKQNDFIDVPIFVLQDSDLAVIA